MSGPRHDGRRPAILAIDTATSHVVIGVAAPDGEALGLSDWPAGHRHGEQLLPAIGRLLGEANVSRSRLTGIVVGTGPGAFTGLRVGLATAKALAHGLGLPIAGIATSEALAAAAARLSDRPIDEVAVLLPAGPSDRTLVAPGARPRILPAAQEPELEAELLLAAVDLVGRAPADAVALGERAREQLGYELLRLGAERLRSGGDELTGLVPEYVTLPRGVSAAVGEVAWSHDRP